MRARLGFAVLAVALVTGALMGAPAKAASFLEKNFWLEGPRYDGDLPLCEDTAALDKISAHFAQKESRFWNSALQIVAFEYVRQVAYRPWAEFTIPRRFCTGRVVTSDGKKRTIHYWIGEDTGFSGFSWGVEWCVVGLDRNWAYNPSCKMALP